MDSYTVQRALMVQGHYTGQIDGILGVRSQQGINNYLASMENSFGLEPGSWTAWPAARRLVAAKQLILHGMSIDAGRVDGLVGPQTQHALSVWQDRTRDYNPPDAEVAHQPTTYPRQADVPRVYGAVGGNQTMLECPYPLKLAWDLNTTVSRFSIHKLVHDSAKRVLQAALEHYGMDAIQALHLDVWGGCLNVRSMRGGSKLSMHSWGIAIDWDPENNQLRWGNDKAWLARPPYTRWWELWQAEGWVSLGRERDFDWMHVQAARL